MSQENVEVVKSLFPLNRELDGQEIAERPDMVRDFLGPLIAENFSVVTVGRGLTTAFPGATGMADAMREYMSAFLNHRTIIERYIDGGDVVVTLGQQRGRTKTHGVEFEAEIGFAVFFDPNGKLRRLEGYQHWSEALEAAGLRE